MLVVWKMRGNPVEDYPEAMLVKVINKVHEILGRTISACGCEVIAGLVSPRAIEGVLGDRQYLEVGKAKFQHVLNKARGKLAIGEPAIALFRHPFPGTKMKFIDRDWGVMGDFISTLAHPVGIIPMIGKITKRRGGSWGKFHGECEWIRFSDLVATMIGDNMKLIEVPCL